MKFKFEASPFTNYELKMDSEAAIAKISEEDACMIPSKTIGCRETDPALRRKNDRKAAARKMSIIRDKYGVQPEKVAGKYRKGSVERRRYYDSGAYRKTVRGQIATWKASDVRRLDQLNTSREELYLAVEV